MINLNKKKKSGFTLVELLVVMGMIGLLASIMLVGLNSSKEKARDSVRMDDLKSLSKAAELYFTKYGDFPVDIYRDESGEDVKDYFTDGVIPTDPKSGAQYEYSADNDNPPKNYCIGTRMEVMDGNGVSCGGGRSLGSNINYIVVGP